MPLMAAQGLQYTARQRVNLVIGNRVGLQIVRLCGDISSNEIHLWWVKSTALMKSLRDEVLAEQGLKKSNSVFYGVAFLLVW